MKIEIKDLYKEIKKNVILDNVNITLTGGKIYGIQGKNGCGKTMLMRSIAGLVIPTRGSIIINGKVLHIGIFLIGNRSEERRVGKECRSRWSPYH